MDYFITIIFICLPQPEWCFLYADFFLRGRVLEHRVQRVDYPPPGPGNGGGVEARARKQVNRDIYIV